MDIFTQLAFNETLMFELIPTSKRTFKLRNRDDLKKQLEEISITSNSENVDLLVMPGIDMRSLGELFN